MPPKKTAVVVGNEAHGVSDELAKMASVRVFIPMCGNAESLNAAVAASIVLETRTVGKIQGLQITGRIEAAQEGDKMLYIKRFPYTAVADLTLWRLEADFMKLTDNTLGFGKKLIWQRQE